MLFFKPTFRVFFWPPKKCFFFFNFAGVVYIDLKNDAPQQTLKKLIDVICSNMTQKKGDNYLLVEKKTIKEIVS